MEIEFNPSRKTDPAGSQPLNQPVKRPAAAPATEPATFDAAQSLERSVKDLPLVRPEEVVRARALVADVKYPPDEMMSRIASLLAMHINK